MVESHPAFNSGHSLSVRSTTHKKTQKKLQYKVDKSKVADLLLAPVSKAVAVIDLGSNSIKLLVARLEADGRIDSLLTQTVEKRISSGISKELPQLSSEAMSVAVETVTELLELADNFNPAQTSIVATSAVRDALNGSDLIDAIEEATGITMRVLSGTEEATYIGKGLACDPRLAGTTDFFQVDLGGGSLELIHFKDSQIDQALSLRLGAVRISERFIPNKEKPISRNIETAISAFVSVELTQSAFSFDPAAIPLIATGGAFAVSRAVLADKAGRSIDEYEASIRYPELEALKSQLCAMSLEERKQVPDLPASRADITPTALITILALMRHAKREAFTHSFYNLRYGIAAEMLNPEATNSMS